MRDSSWAPLKPTELFFSSFFFALFLNDVVASAAGIPRRVFYLPFDIRHSLLFFKCFLLLQQGFFTQFVLWCRTLPPKKEKSDILSIATFYIYSSFRSLARYEVLSLAKVSRVVLVTTRRGFLSSFFFFFLIIY